MSNKIPKMLGQEHGISKGFENKGLGLKMTHIKDPDTGKFYDVNPTPWRIGKKENGTQENGIGQEEEDLH